MNKKDEQELRRRVKILAEDFKQGKIMLPPNFPQESINSILAVRVNSEGEIDLNTVDGTVRSMALAAAFINDREETKKITSLQDIQQTYFNFIERGFGEYYKIMKEKGLNPHDVAVMFSRNESYVKQIEPKIPDFLHRIKEFWNSIYDVASIHLEDLRSLKAVFGGDTFPSAFKNIVSTCGVYVDTIILPDPFLRAELFLIKCPPYQKVYYFVKFALNILNYKELALADVSLPMVAILPAQANMEKDYGKIISQLSNKDSTLHLNKIFGQNFASLEEAAEFLRSLNSTSDALSAMRDKSRLLFDIENNSPIGTQIEEHIEDFGTIMGNKGAGDAILTSCTGRMLQVNDVLVRGNRFHAAPLIEAPTSWQYFKWKLEYDAERLDIKDLKDLHLNQGLQNAAAGEMTWLGNVPVEALIAIRKEGAMEELRQILSRNISSLIDTDAKDFNQTGNQVVKNIKNAFEAHQTDIENLKKKKWRFAGFDVGSFLVKGGIEIASAYNFGFAGPFSFALDEIANTTSLKELPGKYKKLKKESKKLKGSPVGILFEHSKKKK